MWKLPDGKILKHVRKNKFFKIADINHPEINLQYWDDATLIGHGCYRYVEVKYDQKHYRSTGITEVIDGATITATHTLEPRMTLKGLQKDKIREARNVASSLIAPYNWFFWRWIDEPSYSVPSEVKTYTGDVRDAVDLITDEVKALTTYQEVIDYTYNDKWPTNPPSTEDELNGDLIETKEINHG